MGLPIRDLHATNIGDESGKIILSKWIPEKRKNGKYYMPKETPIGLDIWVNNVLDLKEEEGTVLVDIVSSDVDTGLYLFCFNDYFGHEQHLFNYVPPLKENGRIDWMKENDLDDDAWNIHVNCEIDTVDGDGPINVTLKRRNK